MRTFCSSLKRLLFISRFGSTTKSTLLTPPIFWSQASRNFEGSLDILLPLNLIEINPLSPPLLRSKGGSNALAPKANS